LIVVKASSGDAGQGLQINARETGVKRFQGSMRAGCIYFLAMFVAGWTFGPIRETFVSMGVDPLTAVLFEAPAMLLVMYASSAWIVRSFHIRGRVADRLAMGAAAILLVFLAELLGGSAIRGWSMQEGLARFVTAPGRVFSIMLLIGLLMPTLQMRDRLAGRL
jgi:hypothetical protein